MAITVVPYNNVAVPVINSVSSSLSKAAKFYINDRPLDWLYIPDPEENEIYYLIQFSATTDDFGVNITGTGLKYSIQNANGSWADSIDMTSGVDTIITLQYDASRHLTSEENCQYLIKFSGDSITAFRHCGSSYHAAYNVSYIEARPYYTHNVVEIKVNTPLLTGLALNLVQLKYISFYSIMPNVTGMDLSAYSMGFFTGCSALRCIIGLNVPNAVALSVNAGVFQSCINLKYIDILLNPSVFSSYYYIFYNCQSLKEYDLFKAARYSLSGSLYSAYDSSLVESFNLNSQYTVVAVTRLYKTFDSCSYLRKVNLVNTPVCTQYYQTFYSCYLLDEVLGINLSVCTNTSDIFTNCYCLRRLVFAPNQDPAPNCSFDISSSYAFTRDTLLELFNSLPTCTTSRTITLGTRSAGASELTTEDIAIATAKGWTINI